MKLRIRLADFNSLLLVIVFVVPYLIYAKASLSIKSYIDILLFLSYIIVGVYIKRYLFKRKYRNVLLFAFLFVFCAFINQVLNEYFRIYNFIAPLAAYLGYVFVSEKPLSPVPFKILMLFNYLYFYAIYYSLNPVNFFLPESEFNVDAFTNTSSNLIPAILIINLYIFDILDSVKFRSQNKKIIIVFAIINVFLILLQRSRAGIVVSIFFLFIKLYENYKKASFFFIVIIFCLAYYFWPLIVAYSEVAGSINSESYSEDVRKENIDIFFTSMDSIKDVLIGYGSDFEKMTSAVTQNLAITIWNYYTIVPLLVVILLISRRVIKSDFLPITFYSVFVTYSLFEGFFLSNYWDFIIYILIFYRIRLDQTNNRHQKLALNVS